VLDRMPVTRLAEWYARAAEVCGPRVRLGVHCCAAPPWEVLVALGVQVLSFDADRDLASAEAHADSLRSHLQRGGSIAWGIVPVNAEDVRAEHRVQRLCESFRRLELPHRPTRFLEAGFVTPACGLAGLGEPEASARMRLVRQCAALLRRAAHSA
jgi:methionine synthase II (cobalamin-independent)